MQKIFKIKDDVFEEYVSRPLVTGDVGTYKIVLVTEYDLANCSVRITAKRADGVILSDVGTVNGHNAEYVVKSSIYAVEGDVEIRLVIVDRDGNGLTDKALIFNVIANHASGDMQMATNDGHSVADLSLAHIYNYKNPHRVTKSDVGLGNADNTSDLDKPLSNAVKAEFGNVVAMRPDVLNWGVETELSIDTPINECFWFWTDGFEGIDTIVSDGIEYATQTESGASRGLTKDKLYLLKLVGDGYSNGQCVILYEGDKDEFYMSLVSSHTHANKDILDGIMGVDTTPTSGSGRLVTSGGVYGALSGKQATITGGASTITSSNLTASRALVSDASGKVAVSAVTSTELGYLDGVTSNVQTQLNGKTPYAVKSSADFNTMTTPGLYTMRSSSTNAPTTGSYHSLIVNKSDNGNYIQQIAIKESTTDMYMRYCSGSTWSAWRQVAVYDTGVLKGLAHECSGTEYDTGRTWLDGSTIYRKDFCWEITGLTANENNEIYLPDIFGGYRRSDLYIVDCNLICQDGYSVSNLYYDGAYIFWVNPIGTTAEVSGFFEYVKGDYSSVDSIITKTFAKV